MRYLLSFTIFLLSCAFIEAHEDVLFTSSVSYCTPPKAVLIQQFDISYIARNDSVVFNITAASVEPNLTVSANVLLNVYGMEPVNITVDFCHVLGNLLCPLPQYNFSGSGSIPLPSGLNVPSRVPQIAYKVPDLEAFAQATLIDVMTGEVKACVQTTLSNGWSMRQAAVSWSTGAVALLALLQYLFRTLRSKPSPLAAQPLTDLIGLYQHIAFTGLLDLNYPVAYTSFSLNFSWALGLFSSSGAIQRAIDSMRARTGGQVSSVANPTGTANRELSPYNAPPSLGVLSRRDVTSPVTIDSSVNAVPAGIATYVNYLQIAKENTFDTAFFTLLILVAIFAVSYGLLFSLYRVWVRSGKNFNTLEISRNLSIIMLLLVSTPALAFAFYQWTLHDSWLSVFLSVICTLGLCAYLVVVALLLLRETRASNHTSAKQSVFGLAALVGPLRLDVKWFPVLTIISMFSKCLIVGFGQKSGPVQVALWIVVEVGTLVALSIIRPFNRRRINVFGIFMAVIRVINLTLLITFITTLKVAPIPRVVIAFISAVLLSITVLAVCADVGNACIPWRVVKITKWKATTSESGRSEKIQEPLTSRELTSSPPSSQHSLALLAADDRQKIERIEADH